MAASPLYTPSRHHYSRIRERGAIATLITNGYLLTPERIWGLNSAGLDYLQINIDNVLPDAISKKSLKVLDRKLQWLAGFADVENQHRVHIPVALATCEE